MIWAILALLGVPLWLCAIAITVLVFRNRTLRKRYGDVPVRILRSGKKRWTRGHAIWVSDVFAWRASPASWNEGLKKVTDASLHEHVDARTAKKLQSPSSAAAAARRRESRLNGSGVASPHAARACARARRS
jgi:hypothetical protein